MRRSRAKRTHISRCGSDAGSGFWTRNRQDCRLQMPRSASICPFPTQIADSSTADKGASSPTSPWHVRLHAVASCCNWRCHSGLPIVQEVRFDPPPFQAAAVVTGYSLGITLTAPLVQQLDVRASEQKASSQDQSNAVRSGTSTRAPTQRLQRRATGAWRT